jgi:class 3 adenylate cyclase
MDDKDKTGQLDDILRQRKELDEILDARFKRSTTILFTDIVGATTFFSTRGDIEGQLMIKRHNDLLIPLIAKHHGKLLNTMGDGLLASFEMPSQAVACAVEMQEALLRHNEQRVEKDTSRSASESTLVPATSSPVMFMG